MGSVCVGKFLRSRVSHCSVGLDPHNFSKLHAICFSTCLPITKDGCVIIACISFIFGMTSGTDSKHLDGALRSCCTFNHLCALNNLCFESSRRPDFFSLRLARFLIGAGLHMSDRLHMLVQWSKPLSARISQLKSSQLVGWASRLLASALSGRVIEMFASRAGHIRHSGPNLQS